MTPDTAATYPGPLYWIGDQREGMLLVLLLLMTKWRREGLLRRDVPK